MHFIKNPNFFLLKATLKPHELQEKKHCKKYGFYAMFNFIRKKPNLNGVMLIISNFTWRTNLTI
jgi:hypothetical protein